MGKQANLLMRTVSGYGHIDDVFVDLFCNMDQLYSLLEVDA